MTPSPIVLPCRTCIDNGKKCEERSGKHKCEICLENPYNANCDRGIWQEWLEWLGPERESVLLHCLAFNQLARNDARYARNVKWDNLTGLLRDISRPERLFSNEKYEVLKKPWLDLLDGNRIKFGMAFRAIQHIILIAVSLNNFASNNKMPCKCYLYFYIINLLNDLDKFRWYSQCQGSVTHAELYVAQHAWTDNQRKEWEKRTPLERADLCSLLCP